MSGALAAAVAAIYKPAAGGGSVAWDSKVDYAEEDATSPTSTDAWTIAATSNRFALAAMLTRDFGAQATHAGMTLEGVSMTQLGTTAAEAGGTMGVSRWNLFGSGEPAAGSARNLAGSLTVNVPQSVGIIAASVYTGVHQTTPINSTPTAVTGTFSGDTEVTPHPAITGTTVSGGKLVAVLSMENSSGGAPASISGTGVTVRATRTQNGNSLYILEKDDTGGSTTIDLTITFGAATDGSWRLDAYAVQPA